MEYEKVEAGHWVKVIYEEETVIGKVIEKKGGESKVQCLQKPFGIKEPQQMEKEDEAVFYEHMLFCDVRPKTTEKNLRGYVTKFQNFGCIIIE